MSNRVLLLVSAASLALAAVSLVIPYEMVSDAWAWLVWGRELAGGGLDTSLGPSFKPLPVLIAAPLSAAGGLGPELWLVLVRASWLLAPVLAGALAYRLSDRLDRRLRLVAAAFAGLSLLLLADDVTPWLRQGAAGMSDPPHVALVLGCVLAALGGRLRLALGLGGLAALVRPEVWPLLGVYGVWRWREDAGLRPWLAALAVALPALWFVPDLLISGTVGAGPRALRGTGSGLGAIAEVLGRAALMPLAVAWPLALLAVLRRGRDRTLAVLGAGALAWIAIVAAMAAVGFPGLPRFMAPAIAIAGVLAGVGLAGLLATPRSPRGQLAAGLAILVIVAQVAVRAKDLPATMASSARIARSHERVRDLAREVGRRSLLRCGKLAVSDVLVRTELSWQLGIPLADVVSFGEPSTLSGAFVVGPRASRLVVAFMRAHGTLRASDHEWSIYTVGCPEPDAHDLSATHVRAT